ncbi:hypothetical protein R2601_04383 [Salipiger bermudensis HTCC2601]|uniref:Uncharacterized protein n=1 Tax=Salipiger bermudensis (strain DSM 26914 / JCM 13377 / KCTC 12554 / HTCC2601) TaxID=314265 RepID=Q0FVW9_SALBH|nr:hypothetical protein R2601_04383 [Salipiger bermudensis HTCC2601]
MIRQVVVPKATTRPSASISLASEVPMLRPRVMSSPTQV